VKIPRRDAEAIAWMEQKGASLAAQPNLAIDSNTVINCAATISAFRSAIKAQEEAEAVLRDTVRRKTEARAHAESALRTLAGHLRVAALRDPSVLQLLDLGDGKSRTRVQPAKAPPQVSVESVSGRTLRINFRRNSQTKAKPEGMFGAEIWVKVGGDPPLFESECQHLATATRTPFLLKAFRPDQVGQTAHLMVRWVNRRGEPGPFSGPVSATIPL
jgi:hypothetical protein